MKKLVSVMLAMCTCVGLCVPVLAAEPVTNDVVSIEEYEAAIKAEGAKYDIDCNVLSYNPDTKITAEMLDYAVNNVRAYAKSIEKDTQQAPGEITTPVNPVTDSIGIRSMPISKDVSGYFTVNNAYGSASMQADANVTVDARNSTVISVNSTDIYQNGAFVNFDSWETKSVSSKRNSPLTGWITLTVKGRATFSYSDPVTSIKTGYTQNVTKKVKINCD